MTESDVAALRIQLLGPVRAWRGDHELELGGPRRRALLGMLANTRQAVSRGELIDGLWGHAPPASADNSVHVYIAGLRRVLEPRRARRAPSQLLTAVGPGYRLRLEPGTLDTEVLDKHMADARRLALSDPAQAAWSLDAALRLWQGASLSGIPGPWADIERARLDELRQSATADRLDIMLRLGGHHQALAELAALIRQYPLQERFHGQLMLALYRCGRQADALAAFADARRVLAEQLGIDPGPALRRLHQQILLADVTLDPPRGGGGTGRGLVPRELPADVDRFAGRSAELAELDRLLATGGEPDSGGAGAAGTAGAVGAAGAGVVCAVAGSAGVGKTALAGQCARLPLALRVAAELAADRPDMDLAQLVSELADERRRLDLLDAGGDPRTAIRAVFSWSYRRLPAAAARAFRLMGAHPGPDMDKLAVAALTGASAEQAADLIRQLARGHLIYRTEPGRYAMHDLLRAYAANMAGSDAEAEADTSRALTRLFDYYLAVAAEAMDTLIPAEHKYRPDVMAPATPLPDVTDLAGARAWLDAERAVLVRVTGYAAGGAWPGHATSFSSVLWRYLEAGHYTDAVTVHTHAYRAARRVGDYGAEAYALSLLGIVDVRLGRCQQAEASLDRAVALFRAIGERLGEGFALITLACTNRKLGRYTQAADHARDALALLGDVGDQYAQAHALLTLGLSEARLGRYPQATERLRVALALFREIEYRAGEASTLTGLGSVACLRGRLPDAVRKHELALAMFREIGDRAGEAAALNGLGEAALAAGDADAARARHTAALARAREIGDKIEEARAWAGLTGCAPPRDCQQVAERTVAAASGNQSR